MDIKLCQQDDEITDLIFTFHLSLSLWSQKKNIFYIQLKVTNRRIQLTNVPFDSVSVHFGAFCWSFGLFWRLEVNGAITTRGGKVSSLLSRRLTQTPLVRKDVGTQRGKKQPLSKMAATIDNSNAVQATKKKHLGIPEAVFVVSKPRRVPLCPVSTEECDR